MNGINERSYLISTSNGSLNGPFHHIIDSDSHSLNGNVAQYGQTNYQVYNAIANGSNQDFKEQIGHDNMEVFMEQYLALKQIISLQLNFYLENVTVNLKII